MQPDAITESPQNDRRINSIVRLAFYAFVAALPFEYPGRSIPIDPTTLIGALFLFTTLLQPVACYRRPPAAFWWFTIYLYAIVVAFVVGAGAYPGDTLRALAQRVQLLLIFVVGYNLTRDPRTARTTLILLGFGVAVVSLLSLTGALGVADVRASSRLTSFGQNPNRAARILVVGFLSIVGLAYGGAQPSLRPKIVVWGLALLLGLAVLDTGSRGGVLALACGLFTLTLGGRGFGVRARNLALAAVGLTLMTWAALASPLMRHRIELAERGDFAGREEIFPHAWGMFLQKPLVGWGTGENNYELARRIADGEHLSRDTHNLVLELLTSTGILGSVPFLIAFGLCLLATWRSRHGPLGITPFAVLTALLAGNMSGNYIVLKVMWVALAVGMASIHHVIAAPSRAPQRQRAQRWSERSLRWTS